MKFTLLLFFLYRKLKKASKNNSSFKEFIKNEKVKVLIKTADGKRARLYIFDNGEISSLKGDQKQCDVAMVWLDADTAFKVMSSKDLNKSMEALYEGKLRFEGDANQALWFTGAATFLSEKNNKKLAEAEFLSNPVLVFPLNP
jgi:DNA-binding SARP family transcriptional activator